MRIESSKNNHHSEKRAESRAENRDSSNFKTEKSVFDNSHHIKKAEALPSQPSVGAFEKILTEARNESGREKDKFSNAKGNSAESAETSKTDDDLELSRRLEDKAELKEKNRREGKSGNGDSSEDENAAFNAPRFSADSKNSSEISAPAARSILHIADLERIISFVRTEKLRDSKEITIALKHSVLEGLQVKISLDSDGKLKAEFLAANENVKKQLEKRKSELLEILNKRSSKFAEINILTAD